MGNLGWDVREIRARLRRFKGPDYVHPSHLYGPWTELARQLADITPGRLQRSYRATGGTEAVEIALQLAMAATGRSKLVSIEDSYHGNSLGTMSVGASAYREDLPNLLRGCLKIKRPLDANALDQVERLLRKREVAAFIMEPIICNLGALVPDAHSCAASSVFAGGTGRCSSSMRWPRASGARAASLPPSSSASRRTS